MLAAISRPALTDVTLAWEGVEPSDVTPTRVPDLFADRPIVVAGRYDRPGAGRVTLRGRLAGRPYEETLPVTFDGRPSAATHPALSYLWARRRIDELMDDRAFATPEARPALEERVTELALGYHLMSEFTSFVAVDERVRGPAAAERVDVPAEIPRNVPPAVATPTMAQAPAHHTAVTLSRDQTAPGDPEVAVQAPPGARRVTVVFPDGDVVPCAYDARRERWVANFVVPADAADGVYTLRVVVALADGSEIERTARYQVDGRAPAVRLELDASAPRGGAVTLRVVPEAEGPRAEPVGFTDVGAADFAVRVRREVARVEARLPDGSVQRAAPEGDGSFTLRFRAPERAGRHAVDVVALDAAGNATRREGSFAVTAE